MPPKAKKNPALEKVLDLIKEGHIIATTNGMRAIEELAGQKLELSDQAELESEEPTQ